MGSIPTRSRHALPRSGGLHALRAALVLAAALAASSGPPGLGTAAAQEDEAGTRSAPADTTRRRSPPFRVMLRSAVVPGWGQMYNGKPLKAGLVVAGEGLLVYKALEELGKENDAAELAGSLQIGTPEYEQALEAKDRHYNLKVNYIWWAVAVHLLQMADAYVDAHLADFSADLGPGSGPPGRGDPRLALAVRLRF